MGKAPIQVMALTVKRLVTKGSLQRPYNDQILTSDAIINFCNENIHGIKFLNVPPEDVARSETELKVRFELVRTVKGQFHRFVPVSKSRLHTCVQVECTG